MTNEITIGKVDIVVTSDLHGDLPEITKPFDLMLICGDICPVWNHNIAFQFEWLCSNFAVWINNLPIKNGLSRIICVAGNHDLILDGRITKSQMETWKKACGREFVYLDNEAYNFEFLTETGIDKLKIFATPYCKVFGNWAFMREDLTKYYDEIPDDIDILISHDAADINDLGFIKEGVYSGRNAGNTVLAEYVKKIKPKYYFCGHIHSGTHRFEKVDDTYCANVSYVSERYIPTYLPFEFSVNSNKEVILEDEK